jgi:hypothetical protein
MGRIGCFSRAALLALALVLPACDNTGTSTGSDPSEFVGSWAENGQEWITCGGTAGTPTQITGTFTVNRGVDAPLSVILPNSSCILNMDVDGNTATLRPAQSCSETTSGATVTIALTSGTISLSDATSGTMNLAGTATVSSGTKSVQCTLSAMATLNKVGQ